MEKTYRIGTPEMQEYLKKYYYIPHGLGFVEPGVTAADAKEYVAFNIAKSMYQTHPEVFNLKYVSKQVGIPEKEVAERITKMYRNHYMMLVANSSVNVYGWGLYYWVVKLKKDATPAQRKELSDWFQNNDQICTGYAMEAGGEFDFFNGNHMRNMDNLVFGVLDKFRFRDYIEYVHIVPVRRLIRESHVNQFDALKDYRHYFWSDEQKKNVLKFQKKMDATDFAIIDALNNTPSIGDTFDYKVLGELSGLDPAVMKKDLCMVVDKDKCRMPLIYFNYRALGLKMHFFLVSFFQNTPTWRSEQIADELAENPAFENIFDFCDAHHNMILSAYEDITDLDALRKDILKYGEVAEVLEATSARQFRRWTNRLDYEDGWYEEAIFTDDLLQDHSTESPVICPNCKDPEWNDVTDKKEAK
ncbi:MAG: hypothetical protein VZQ81_05955 [Succiniclasticum sp.]|jgi:hypothetical protein|nr:hypothetical protein [Succiniclasticum sp.]MEE3479548.1 hypothetical protein [Succiniclasticum sp.]